jgi:hypothetical protein
VLAHLTIQNNRLDWSGYGASGDPRHRPYALVADVGRDFLITSEGELYLHGPGPMHFEEFTPNGFVLAARSGWFGFRVLAEGEAGSRQRDRREQERRKLGRRGRIAADQKSTARGGTPFAGRT